MLNKGVGLYREVGGGQVFKINKQKRGFVSKFTLIKLLFNRRRFIYFASMPKIQIYLYLYPQIPPKYGVFLWAGGKS